MDKMLKKCCMLALAGGMVFGGGCLNFGGVWKFAGRGLAEGAGWSLGTGLTNEFVTNGITATARAADAFNQADMIGHLAEDHTHDDAD